MSDFEDNNSYHGTFKSLKMQPILIFFQAAITLVVQIFFAGRIYLRKLLH